VRNVKLTIEYDGTDFFGWQKQPNRRTVQEVIENTIRKVLGEEIHLIGAGRTDRGVHALGQVASFKTTSRFSLEAMFKAFNALLPEDVVIHEIEEVPLAFHPRYWAKSKTYEYVILLKPIRSPLIRRFCWHVPQVLDVEAMRECCEILKGSHDFSSFQLSGSSVKNPIREMLRAEITLDPPFLFLLFEASGFLRGMVRSIVGTLIDVGRGKIKPHEFREILEARDRKKASLTAPAQGLFLVEVKYGDYHFMDRFPKEGGVRGCTRNYFRVLRT
jgi:tRNA pseudouridine38-40 synthase